MNTQKGFFLTPQISIMERIKYVMVTGFGYNPDYKLYVPDRFVLGDFRKIKNNLSFSGKFSYVDDKHVLDKYFKSIRDGSLILFRWTEISDQLVDEITSCGNLYNESKRTLADLTQFSLPAFLNDFLIKNK